MVEQRRDKMAKGGNNKMARKTTKERGEEGVHLKGALKNRII